MPQAAAAHKMLLIRTGILKIITVIDIITEYSRTSMAQTPLEPKKYVHGRGSSS